MATKITMVATQGMAAPIDEQQVVDALAARWPGLSVGTGWPGDDSAPDNKNALFFDVNGQKIAALVMPAAIPWGDLEWPASQSFLWPDAAAELQEHDGHIIVTVMSDAEPLDQARALTHAVAGIIDATPAAVGVYDGDAMLVVPAPLHQELASVLPEANPLFLWVNYLVGVDGGRVFGFTTGMESLGQLDIESVDATDDPGEFRGRMHDLCAYVLESGATIESGHTVGHHEDERIRVIHGTSSYGLDRTVMQLHYERD